MKLFIHNKNVHMFPKVPDARYGDASAVFQLVARLDKKANPVKLYSQNSQIRKANHAVLIPAACFAGEAA